MALKGGTRGGGEVGLELVVVFVVVRVEMGGVAPAVPRIIPPPFAVAVVTLPCCGRTVSS